MSHQLSLYSKPSDFKDEERSVPKVTVGGCNMNVHELLTNTVRKIQKKKDEIKYLENCATELSCKMTYSSDISSETRLKALESKQNAIQKRITSNLLNIVNLKKEMFENVVMLCDMIIADYDLKIIKAVTAINNKNCRNQPKELSGIVSDINKKINEYTEKIPDKDKFTYTDLCNEFKFDNKSVSTLLTETNTRNTYYITLANMLGTIVTKPQDFQFEKLPFCFSNLTAVIEKKINDEIAQAEMVQSIVKYVYAAAAISELKNVCEFYTDISNTASFPNTNTKAFMENIFTGEELVYLKLANRNLTNTKTNLQGAAPSETKLQKTAPSGNRTMAPEEGNEK